MWFSLFGIVAPPSSLPPPPSPHLPNKEYGLHWSFDSCGLKSTEAHKGHIFPEYTSSNKKLHISQNENALQTI